MFDLIKQVLCPLNFNLHQHTDYFDNAMIPSSVKVIKDFNLQIFSVAISLVSQKRLPNKAYLDNQHKHPKNHLCLCVGIEQGDPLYRIRLSRFGSICFDSFEDELVFGFGYGFGCCLN